MGTHYCTDGTPFVVDDCDDEVVASRRWYAKRDKRKRKPKAYVTSGEFRNSVILHRLIAGATRGVHVDHVDGDTLNNRRSNLRLCTNAENSRNVTAHVDSRTGIKGIHFCRSTGRWRAQICLEGERIHLGRFSTKEQAHEAYCKAAKALHGQFANTGSVRSTAA